MLRQTKPLGFIARHLLARCEYVKDCTLDFLRSCYKIAGQMAALTFLICQIRSIQDKYKFFPTLNLLNFNVDNFCARTPLTPHFFPL